MLTKKERNFNTYMRMDGNCNEMRMLRTFFYSRSLRNSVEIKNFVMQDIYTQFQKSLSVKIPLFYLHTQIPGHYFITISAILYFSFRNCYSIHLKFESFASKLQSLPFFNNWFSHILTWTRKEI